MMAARAAGCLDVLVDRKEVSFGRLRSSHRIGSLFELKRILRA